MAQRDRGILDWDCEDFDRDDDEDGDCREVSLIVIVRYLGSSSRGS